MKILYVIEGGLPYGSNRSLIGLIEHLVNDGVEVIVAGRSGGEMRAWVESLGGTYFPTYVAFLVWPRSNSLLRRVFFPVFVAGRILMNLVAVPRLIGICLRMQPDLIHTNVGPVSVGYFAARLLGIKHVWHLREFQGSGLGLKFFPSKRAYLKRLKRSDAVVCVSKAIAAHFDQPESSVVYNGVQSRTERSVIEEKDSCFLFVANLQPSKGVDLVIDAFGYFLARTGLQYELHIVGDGCVEYLAKLRSLAEERSGRGRVRFLGYRDDVPDLMRKAKAVIVAAENEGFGRVAAEAMFNGSLVIGRNSAGTAEILESVEGRCVGLSFSDRASLIERMCEAAAMYENDYRSIVERAQMKALNCFSLEACAERTLAMYRQMSGIVGEDK